MTFDFSFEPAVPLPVAEPTPPAAPRGSTPLSTAKPLLQPALPQAVPNQEETPPQPQPKERIEQPSSAPALSPAAGNGLIIQPVATATPPVSETGTKAAPSTNASANNASTASPVSQAVASTVSANAPGIPSAVAETHPASSAGANTTSSANASANNPSTTSTSSGSPVRTAFIKADPNYAFNPPPEYPALARRRGYEGLVSLEVFVDRQGKVTDLKIAQSSGFAILDQAALQAVKKWIFKPAQKGPETIADRVKVPIRFQLQ
jgi:protein TonB